MVNVLNLFCLVWLGMKKCKYLKLQKLVKSQLGKKNVKIAKCLSQLGIENVKIKSKQAV